MNVFLLGHVLALSVSHKVGDSAFTAQTHLFITISAFLFKNGYVPERSHFLIINLKERWNCFEKWMLELSSSEFPPPGGGGNHVKN